MGSLFDLLKNGRIFKVNVACVIVTWLVLQITVAAPLAFAVEALESVGKETKVVLQNSVAVLPFESLSPNPDNAYFALGVHGEILDHLTKIRDLSPIFRSTILRYAGTDQPIIDIASELNVETVVKSSVRYADNRIYIAVQIIDGTNNNQLWSEEYERDLSDIFAVQAEIVENIAMVLGADMSATEQERIRKVPTRSLEAYALYLKARTLAKTLNPVMPPMFYEYLDQVIALAPDFAVAHAVKASVYGLTISPGQRINELMLDEMKRIALEHTEKALALDPNLGMAHWAQALIYFNSQRKGETIQSYKRTLELRPNDARILDEYTRFLTYIGGKDEEAIRLTQRTLALVPNDISRYGRLGRTLMFAGLPREGADIFRKSIELSPSTDFLYMWLGMMEIILGNDTEALKQLRLTEEKLAGQYQPFIICRLAYFYSMLGLKEDAERLVKKVKERANAGRFTRVSTWTLSYLAIGENDKAYNVLNKNPNEGISSLQIIKSNVMNAPVLEEPRFVELRKRIGSFD